MNLHNARTLLSKLSIKDRELNISVPFILNTNQSKAHLKLAEAYDKSKWIRTIVLKSRRVGMSSYIDAQLSVTVFLAPRRTLKSLRT